jgi:Trp operon repressor
MLNVGVATVTRGANAFENEKIFEVKIPILETLRLYKNKKNE